MREHLKKKFQLTDEGVKGTLHAIKLSFIVYCLLLAPVCLLMLLGNQLILGNVSSTWEYIGIAVVALALLFIALYFEYDAMFNASYRESANLRIDIAKTLANLPLSYFTKHDLSDLAQSIMQDVATIEHAMSHSIPKIYAFYLFIPVIGFMLLSGNVWMGLAVIVPALLRVLVLVIFQDQIVSGNAQYHQVLRDNSEKFQEVIEMHQEIKGYNLSQKIQSELNAQMEYSEKVHLASETKAIIALSTSSLFSFISLGVVLAVGTQLLIGGQINILYLLGYVLAAMKIKEVVDVSSEGFMEILYVAAPVARIKEIKEAVLQEGQDVDLSSFDIELNHVSFAYDEDTPVLKDVSFTAKQGEVTALVGASGCGKSTLLKLISRLYDYDAGSICIDGQDIKAISTDSLFDKTSIVFQDVILFNTSVMENIRIGRPDATDEEVIEAAQLANCIEFIDKMPEGFDTSIGENGAELSGGERQRLSIARAFLKNAPILILDEIAASLDVENEQKIQDSLNKLIQNKTVIVISHRLKSVENVNKIVVLDDGHVESVGSHQELMSTSAIYQNLIQKSQLAETFSY